MTSTPRRGIMVGWSGDPNQSASFSVGMATALAMTEVSRCSTAVLFFRACFRSFGSSACQPTN